MFLLFPLLSVWVPNVNNLILYSYHDKFRMLLKFPFQSIPHINGTAYRWQTLKMLLPLFSLWIISREGGAFELLYNLICNTCFDFHSCTFALILVCYPPNAVISFNNLIVVLLIRLFLCFIQWVRICLCVRLQLVVLIRSFFNLFYILRRISNVLD